jgi:hypothetical protein
MTGAHAFAFSSASAFAVANRPGSLVLEHPGRVRFLLVSGKQDDDSWGVVGALWLSDDGDRGGFLVNPWSLWVGSEIVRGYRSALDRGWSPERIFEYWGTEVWRGSYSVDDEQRAGSLGLLVELVNAL